MTSYRHTQTAFGPWLVALAGVVVLAAIFVATDELRGSNLLVLMALVFVVVLGLVFARLTVTVGEDSVAVAFGAGWPRRTIPIAEIVAAHAVRNRWWHGWGVRLIPGGTMYNVRGFDAVELQLRSGKVFRIGTDEPDVLLAALPVGPLR